MRLSDRRNVYKTLQHDIRALAAQAGLDWMKDFKNQAPVALGHLYKVARDMHPFLSQFIGDWVIAEIVMQWMQNKCKHAVQMSYIPKCEERIAAKKEGGDINPDHIMDDEDPFAGYFETENPEEDEDEVVDDNTDRE
ncbi:hypothetical protein A0H81_11889 [Grifola frondosa]|uniref:Uncharacterized protein n=1 Tax=Grifola frondosa TaxID=5627 RepID=A0A1C7LZA0_GRIFR|nr:hypothetical protein A0H81_11889 [Grifola frondosa]